MTGGSGVFIGEGGTGVATLSSGGGDTQLVLSC